MSFADDLRRTSSGYRSPDSRRREMDSLAQAIVGAVKGMCEEAAASGRSCVEGFIRRDDYEGKLYLCPRSEYSMCYGSAEERRAAQKRRASTYTLSTEKPGTVRRTEPRSGLLSDLGEQEARYVADSVAAQLAGLGLRVGNSLVQFHDIQCVRATGVITGFTRISYEELPTTYPNLLISVGW